MSFFPLPYCFTIPLRGNDLPLHCLLLRFRETCSSFPSGARAAHRRTGIMSTHSIRSTCSPSSNRNHVYTFHQEHVQPIVEQESCLHIHVDKQLSFAEDRRSKARFLLSEITILHTVLSAPTHSRYTPQSLRAQFRDFSGRSLTCGLAVQKSISNWTHFSLYS